MLDCRPLLSERRLAQAMSFSCRGRRTTFPGEPPGRSGELRPAMNQAQRVAGSFRPRTVEGPDDVEGQRGDSVMRLPDPGCAGRAQRAALVCEVRGCPWPPGIGKPLPVEGSRLHRRLEGGWRRSHHRLGPAVHAAPIPHVLVVADRNGRLFLPDRGALPTQPGAGGTGHLVPPGRSGSALRNVPDPLAVGGRTPAALSYPELHQRLFFPPLWIPPERGGCNPDGARVRIGEQTCRAFEACPGAGCRPRHTVDGRSRDPGRLWADACDSLAAQDGIQHDPSFGRRDLRGAQEPGQPEPLVFGWEMNQ